MNPIRGAVAAAMLLTAGATLGAGRQLTGVYAPTPTPALPAEEARKKFTVPEGFEMRLFAAEPDVVNPVAMTWDERGRLWVVELYEYPLGAPAGAKPRDQVKILEDTDGDGRADKVTVFADGLNLATGLLLGYGGVFVGQAPHLYFMEDTDGDDVADKKTIAMTGFGLEDRHELLNGFTWGPDGQLYMTHGVFTYSKVKDPNDPDDDGVVMTAAVARFDPKSKKFEIFAEGTSNPWGVEFDARGNAFVSACVIDHLFHMAPGGVYTRQAGNPPNPHTYGLLPSIVDHKHFRAAYAGVQVYEGDQYPAEYRGMVFMGNIHDSSIHQDVLTPNGSSFKASFKQDFVRSGDGWFRPVSVQTGPDGALWIMDWYDKYPCYQNANADPEGVDRTHGRIWRVVHTGGQPGKAVPPAPKGMNLRNLGGKELAGLLAHANSWHRRMAQRLLSERPDASARPELLKLIAENKSESARLSALWTLHSSGLLEEGDLDRLAGDQMASMRTWVARFTGERGRPTYASAQRLTKLAGDADPSVVLAVATALRQFTSGSLTLNTPPAHAPEGDMGPVFARIIGRPELAGDPVIPFLVWMAGEPEVARAPMAVLGFLLGQGADSPAFAGKMLQKAMRRICDLGDRSILGEALELVAAAAAGAPEAVVGAMDGLIEGQRARALLPESGSSEFLTAIAASGNEELERKARQLGAIWGDAAAVQSALNTIGNRSSPISDRIRAVTAVRQQRLPAVRDALLAVLDGEQPDALVQAALAALSEQGGDDVGQIIVSRWGKLGPASRRLASDVLAGRRRWAEAFLNSVESKRIASSEIHPSVVRSLLGSKDDYVRSRATAVIGRFRESQPDKVKLIESKRRMVLEGAADLANGREVARKTCFTCHKLHGEGHEVGPDLTGVGRSSIDALLANVIDPNQLIGKGYENFEVETKDGRVVAGRLMEETSTHVRILSTGGKEDVIAIQDIESRRVSELSVMPEGLEQMPDADFRDMIWFLLNPPEDRKAIQVLPGEKSLRVMARLPGAEKEVELLGYVADPALRPYLHPVRDPAGRVVLTEDKPADHVWQHGIYTGLHKVNGLDFWTEREGRQRFVRLLNIHQEQGSAGWVALAEWVAPDGKVLLEEEQRVTVHAPSGPAHYDIDFEWVLRAAGDTVKIGRYDYGGLSVRLVHNGTHTHLNSQGRRGKEIYAQRAAWCNVARAFDEGVFGVAVFDHPSNPGHPAFFRGDDFGFINPSPSLAGDWEVAKGAESVRRYRLRVHAGSGSVEALQAAFTEYAANSFGAQAAEVADGESVALWNPEWRLVAPDFEGSPRKLPEFHGRRNVLQTHPFSQERGAALERVLEIPAGSKTEMSVWVAAHDQGDWLLRVVAGGRTLLEQVVNRSGERWRQVKVDLSQFAGQKLPIRLENRANNWEWEFGHWSDLRVVATPVTTAAK